MTLTQQVKAMIDKNLLDALNDVHTIIKARVVSVDVASGKCTVKPIPKREIKGQVMEYPALIECELDFKTYGDWKVSFPRVPGDLVYVAFEETGEDDDNVHERFSLNNPLIIGSVPSTKGGFTGNDGFTIEGAGTIIKLSSSGDITIKSGANKTTIQSNVEITGDLKVLGKTTGVGEGTFNNIKVSEHVHGGVQGGPSKTSKPE